MCACMRACVVVWGYFCKNQQTINCILLPLAQNLCVIRKIQNTCLLDYSCCFSECRLGGFLQGRIPCEILQLLEPLGMHVSNNIHFSKYL